MANNFFETSKNIANDFLQSIVFIDDRAYPSPELKDNGKEINLDHEFNALEVSKAFAKEQKICAVYKPESKKDINDFIAIAQKADVVILDWQITIVDENALGNPEEDEEHDDPRGVHTKEIIKKILYIDEVGHSLNSLKMIIVYTGDYTYLEQIIVEIYKESLGSSGDYSINKESLKLESKNVKIIIRSKEVTVKHAGNEKSYADKILKYEELPSFVLDEFTQMTLGLLSNFALISLTTIRQNSHKILSLFSKEIDSAYLGHKSLLSNSEDAESLLIEIMKDSISDLLTYNETTKFLNKNLFEEWLKNFLFEEDFSIVNKKGNKLNPEIKFLKSHKVLMDILYSQEIKVDKRFETIFKDLIADKTNYNEFLSYLSIDSTSLFLNNNQQNKIDEINKLFAKLTHHKSVFIPHNTKPRLTLGTIIKGTINNTYYICIQQKCDSVRIYGTERKFLFLPLKIITGRENFDIITPEGDKLNIDKKSFSIKTIKFIGDPNEGAILGEAIGGGKFIFKQKYIEDKDEQFEWVLDLKDLHSQRIVANFAATLSRVGLDESEWLRRASEKKVH